ncbi:MAG: flagellar motor switch protein FliN [Spirochaetales bacterium]|nr:flagellar motor switch protein FliN [Spirochaetales bacterium]
MSDGSLSQDEIDALLQGTDNIDFDSGFQDVGGGLSDQDKSAFLGILQGVVESQSSNISMLTSQTIAISGPTLSIMPGDQLLGLLPDSVVEVKADFSGGLSGEHSSIMDTDFALKTAEMMLGQEGVELDEMALSTLSEAVSNISSPALTAIGNKINQTVTTEPPEAKRIPKAAISLPQGDQIVVAEYKVKVNGGTSKLFEIYSTDVVKQVTGGHSGGGAETSIMDTGDLDAMFGGGLGGNDVMGGQSGQPKMNGNGLSGLMGGGNPGLGSPSVQSVQFPNLQGQNISHEQGNIGLLMDVYMEMTVELGRTKKLIKDILGIGEGTIIELDKLAGEPVDILVNHKLIAKGEVVVIDENFGVRVTEIVSPMDRMNDMT